MKKLVFIVFLVMICYFPLLSAHQTVDPDAQIILPNLESFHSVSEYFSGLFSLKTIDFQPVRDLTLALDMMIFRTYNINTVIWQNVIWWLGSLVFIFLILKKLFEKEDDSKLLILTSLFAIYPLFVPVVSWGMSRKHLLSFFFILLSIYQLIRFNSYSLKNSLKLLATFTLSVFSQPITMLWPVWASLFLIKERKLKRNQTLNFLFPVYSMSAITIGLNYWYYEFSPTFRFHFNDKTDQAFNIADKILGIGHYTFQLLLPYKMSFKYQLGDPEVMIGFILFIVASILIYKVKSLRELSLKWVTLGALPILIVLNTPHVMSDSYLLLPGFSLLLISAHYLISTPIKKFFAFALPLILIWTIYSHIETKNWLSPVRLTEVSFERRQNCMNAYNVMKTTYEAGNASPADARKFFEENKCIQQLATTAYANTANVNFLSNVMYYENDIPLDFKIKMLEGYSQRSMLAHLTLAALYLRNNKETEARAAIQEVINRSKNIEISGKDYHPATANVVQPYCEKTQWSECLAITSKLTKRISSTYIP